MHPAVRLNRRTSGEGEPDLVARDEDGKVTTVRYEAANAMLLNEFSKGAPQTRRTAMHYLWTEVCLDEAPGDDREAGNRVSHSRRAAAEANRRADERVAKGE